MRVARIAFRQFVSASDVSSTDGYGESLFVYADGRVKRSQQRSFTFACELNLAEMNLGPVDMMVISALIQTGLIARLTSLSVSGNPGMVATLCWGDVEQVDANLTELKQFLDVVGLLDKLESLDLGNIGMGPKGAVLTSELLSSPKITAAGISFLAATDVQVLDAHNQVEVIKDAYMAIQPDVDMTAFFRSKGWDYARRSAK